MVAMLLSGSLSRLGEGQGEGESQRDYRFYSAKFIRMPQSSVEAILAVRRFNTDSVSVSPSLVAFLVIFEDRFLPFFLLRFVAYF